jgi:hypothetical protein
METTSKNETPAFHPEAIAANKLEANMAWSMQTLHPATPVSPQMAARAELVRSALNCTVY